MEGQQFIYDSVDASGAVARAAEHARSDPAITVVDVASEHNSQAVVDAYRGLLAGGHGTFTEQIGSLGDVDPADGVFVGQVDGERTVLVGEQALAALR